MIGSVLQTHGVYRPAVTLNPWAGASIVVAFAVNEEGWRNLMKAGYQPLMIEKNEAYYDAFKTALKRGQVDSDVRRWLQRNSILLQGSKL